MAFGGGGAKAVNVAAVKYGDGQMACRLFLAARAMALSGGLGTGRD
jgi:hypothetical protein